MLNKTSKTQAGFAIIPVIIIAAALLVGGAAVGTGVYLSNKNTGEVESLTNEISTLKEQLQPTTSPASIQPTTEPSPAPESSKAPSETITPPPAPKVQAATTTTASSAIPDASVPAVVEREFRAVYGRNPSASESNHWKAQVRSNGWTVSQLQAALKSSQSTTASQSTPQPSQQSQTSKKEQCEQLALSAKSKYVVQLEEMKAKYQPQHDKNYYSLIAQGRYDEAQALQAQWQQAINNINNSMTHAYDIALSNCLSGT